MAGDKDKPGAGTRSSGSKTRDAADTAPSGDAAGAEGDPGDPSPTTAAMPVTPLQAYRSRLMQQSGATPASAGAGGASASFPALNSQIVQAVEFTNEETASSAPALIATPADAMISQAAGLAAQSSAHYYDGMTKLVMASQSVMLQKLTEDLSQEKLPQAAEQAIGIAVTELLLAGAMAVAAAGGAMEAESASFSIEKINQAVETLKTTTSGQ